MTKSQHYFGPWPGVSVGPNYSDEALLCVFSVNTEALNHDFTKGPDRCLCIGFPPAVSLTPIDIIERCQI